MKHTAEMNLPVGSPKPVDWITQYEPPAGVYDELIDADGGVRPHWKTAVGGFAAIGVDGLEGRRKQAHALLHEHGATLNAFGDSPLESRPWTLDMLPLMLDGDEWRRLAQGIAQRARLLQRLLDDLYGPQEVLKQKLIPPEAVFGNPQFQNAFRHDANRSRQMLHLVGTELARSSDGRWWVMADRSDRAFGIGYALENRIVLSRSMPGLIRSCQVERLAPFFKRLQQTLTGLTRRATEFPRIVLLSGGPSSPVYFEDQYLARYLGYTLVESGDLAVRNDCVAVKTLDGLLPVDVILRRVPEQTIDPLELGGSSPLGVPGLLQAERKGNVALANEPGTGLFESPVFMPYLSGLCKGLLGEELLIPSIASWWCQDTKARSYVLEHLDRLVIKPAFQYSGSEEFVVSELSSVERERLIEQIKASPAEYVGQETIQRSVAPTWTAEGVRTGQVALRAFSVSAGDDFEVMPGALVRVAAESGPMELSIAAGDSSKDAWVVSDEPVQPVSLLPDANEPLPIARSGSQLPSRAADDLFWLGRSIDRAETSARLLRAIADRLACEGGSEDAPEIPALLRVLAAEGQIEPGLAVEGVADPMPKLEEMLPRSVFDVSESSSLRSTVNELTRLASSVRDRISLDTWRTITRIDEQFRPDVESGETPLADSLDSLDRFILDLAACSGLISEGMVRSPAWRFLDMGRKVERCLCSIDLLRYSICHENAAQYLREILDALLDVVDCRSIYRTRYLAGVRAAPVVDLLVTDETNPRSIAYQLVRLSEHVDALPRESLGVGLTAAQKLIRTAVHELRMLDVIRLCDQAEPEFQELEGVLENTAELVKSLVDDLTRRYLVHSGPPRQIFDEQPPID